MTDSTSDRDGTSPDEGTALPTRRSAIKAIVGAAAAAGGLAQSSIAAATETPSTGASHLGMLDKMAVKPTSLSMQPRLTYLG